MYRMKLRKNVYESNAWPTCAQDHPAAVAACTPKESAKELKQREKQGDPTAMLALADIYMYGFKGVERNPQHAIDLYYKAAHGGSPEACTAVAYGCYCELLGREPKGSVPCNRTERQRQIVQQMWHWLDKAAEGGWVSPLLLRLGAEAERTGSWTLSEPVVAALRESEKAVELEKQKRIEMDTIRDFEVWQKELEDLETEAKAMQARGWDVGHGGGGGQGRRRRKQKKKKKGKTVKRREPSVMVLALDQLIQAQVAINAKTPEDCCSICQTGWNKFETLTLASVATCGHATCAPCLSQYHTECKKTLETELGDAKTLFRCVNCRQPFPRNIISNMATTVVQKNVIPSFRLLIDRLGLATGQVQDGVLAALLTQHAFDIPRTSEVLFNMVGLVSHDRTKDHGHDAKQDIYLPARAPVRAIEAEYATLRKHLAQAFETDSAEWQASLAKLRAVSKQLETARLNAARDIFERMNAAGRMGAADEHRGYICVDLHGLHLKEAEEMLEQFVVAVLPVLKSVIVITGRGSHSADGVGVLKEGVRKFVESLGRRCKNVRGNAGALKVE
ncbi:hypothetical protein HK104_011380 [Borealophlyctis nickersoniae]|nr:hypothetical protein HK104_011380 [Borealophlyctis nickersoniae]